MTVTVLNPHNDHLEVIESRVSLDKPQQLEPLRVAQSVYDYRLSLLEQQIRQLRVEHAEAFAKRQVVVKEIEANSNKPIDKIPLLHVATFLSPKDVSNLSIVCSRFRSELTDHGTFLPNLVVRNANATASRICRLVKSLSLSSIANLHLDARLESNGHLLYFLAQKASDMKHLRSFSLTNGTVNLDMQNSLTLFFENLPRDSLHSVHLSGIRQLQTIGKVVTSQSGSLRSLRVDYLATDHGKEVNFEILPPLPKIQFLWFDVADLSEAPISVISDILEKIENPNQLTTLYLPHVELLGDQNSFRNLANRLCKFPSLNQCVLRFHGFYVPVDEIYALRRAFEHLPAFNISRHFLIAMKKWAPWWPKITEVWKSREHVTGRAIFKEQIEFSSLGSSADREWLRLPRQEKRLWNEVIAPQVLKMF